MVRTVATRRQGARSRTQAALEATRGAASPPRYRASPKAGIHDAIAAMAGSRAERRSRTRAWSGGVATARIDSIGCHRAPAPRTFPERLQPRPAALGVVDPRALVCTVRTLLLALAPVRPLSIVHTENSAGWGGQEIRILTEARGMLERGHRVTLLTPPETPIYDAAARYGVPAVPLGIRRKQPSDLCVLRAWLSSHRQSIDILNTHSSTDSWLGALSCASMANAPPIVRTRHVSTHINNSAATRWLYCRAAAHIVTAGEAVRRSIADPTAVPPEGMTSVPTGIDLQQFVPGDAVIARSRVGLPQRPTLGIVATLRDWKGHEYLFEAIALERNAWADWNILVVGEI